MADLTPEKIEQGRKLLERCQLAPSLRINPRFDDHALEAWLRRNAQALLAAAELGMAWEAEAKAWREWRRLHDLRGATCRDAESWNAYKEPRENAWMKICDACAATDQLTGRIGASTPTP